ncbi:MAG: phage holin family protein [Chloroflexota bacterium]
MKTLLLRWAVIVIAVYLVAWGLPQTGLFGDKQLVGFGDNWVTLAIFAAVLALLNTFVRPILAFISIPFTCLTGGLFLIVINTALFALAAWLVPDISVSDFWGAVVGAIAVSIVGIGVGLLTGEKAV